MSYKFAVFRKFVHKHFMATKDSITTSNGNDNKSDDEILYVKKLRSCMNDGFGLPHGATKIFDFLYLSGEDEAIDMKLLSDLKITHVINCAAGYCATGTNFYGDKIRQYVEFPAEDDDRYDIMQHFDETHDVIEDARKSGGRALIHCLMGVNRSGALTVAYTMCHRNCGPITAAVFVRTKRRMLLTNEGFQLQLIKFARSRELLALDDSEVKKKDCSEGGKL